MTDRSRLLSEVLRTWDQSDEGRGYLEWLLQHEPEKLDGGDVLREAVLDVIEDDEQLSALRNAKAKDSRDKFFAEAGLPEDAENQVRESTAALTAAFSKRTEIIRQKVATLSRIRRLIKQDRLETLNFVSQLGEMSDSRRISALRRFEQNFLAAEELASRVAALSRTTLETVDLEAEWLEHSSDETSFGEWLQSSRKAGEGWFDYVSEELDRHYSRELVGRLEEIVQRASVLDTVQIKVKNDSVRKLFREAHEAYIYGFDVASIALCRSLLEHALKDILALPESVNMKLLGRPTEDSLINRAAEKALLREPELTNAKDLARAGNKVMHNGSSNRKTAHDVLVSTRLVLNQLYA